MITYYFSVVQLRYLAQSLAQSRLLNKYKHCLLFLLEYGQVHLRMPNTQLSFLMHQRHLGLKGALSWLNVFRFKTCLLPPIVLL